MYLPYCVVSKYFPIVLDIAIQCCMKLHIIIAGIFHGGIICTILHTDIIHEISDTDNSIGLI